MPSHECSLCVQRDWHFNQNFSNLKSTLIDMQKQQQQQTHEHQSKAVKNWLPNVSNQAKYNTTVAPPIIILCHFITVIVVTPLVFLFRQRHFDDGLMLLFLFFTFITFSELAHHHPHLIFLNFHLMCTSKPTASMISILKLHSICILAHPLARSLTAGQFHSLMDSTLAHHEKYRYVDKW